MKTVFHSQLTNDEFGDPGVYVEMPLERRAILFDLGDISALSPRQLLRVTDIFVSHTHMDHFIGFDQLLRVLLGREKSVRLYGPVGFIEQVGHRLAAYTWNLVDNFDQVLELEVTEITPGGEQWHCRFRSDLGFSAGMVSRRTAPLGPWTLLQEPLLTVRTAVLDHHIPVLAFRLEEPFHLGVLKNVVDEMGLGLGPWIHDARKALMGNAPGETVMRVRWSEDGEEREQYLPLRQLRAVFKPSHGQVLTYVVDAGYNEWNIERIVQLARHADPLYIETFYRHTLVAEAAARKHLTARQAGLLAARAEVKRVIPLHFSSRHDGEADLLRAEIQEAFSEGC